MNLPTTMSTSIITVQNQVAKCRRQDKCVQEYFDLKPEFIADTNQNQESKQEQCIRLVQACMSYAQGSPVSSEHNFISRRTRREALLTAAYVVVQRRLYHEIVTRLLSMIFSHDGCFVAMFFDMDIFRRYARIRQRSFFGPLNVDDRGLRPLVSDEESTRVMTFYLDYATQQKLMFTGRPPAARWYGSGAARRFVDLALEKQVDAQLPAVATALDLANVQMLRILLRHGACLDFSEEDANSFQADLFFTTCLLKEYLRDRSGFIAALPSDHENCLQLLLRALPQLDPMAWLNHRKLCDPDTRRFAEHLRDEVLPPSRCGQEPPELKHLCRCLIREELRKNWQLPGGIYLLSLPRSVAQYLDLETD